MFGLGYTVQLNSSPIHELGIRCGKVEVLDVQIPAQGGNHGNPATVHHPTPVTLKTQWNTYHKGRGGWEQ